MEVALNYREIGTDPEIRMYRQEEMTISAMVASEGVEPDERGRKVVPIGTLIDKDGKICKLTESGIEGTPIGITHDTKVVTYGNQEVAIYIHGHLKGPMLNFEGEEYNEKMGQAIEQALPGIFVYPRTNAAAAAAGAAGQSTTVDLSKATGTLAIANGGTGATSAGDALDALLESQPLPITKGGTGASDKDTAVTNLGAQKAGE